MIDIKITNASQNTDAVHHASTIMIEVARWLVQKGEPMWSEDILTPEHLLQSYDPSEIYVVYDQNAPCATFVLQWADEELWPDANDNESGYVHKLSIARKYKGQGVSRQIFDWCKQQCADRGMPYLRLDCDANRPGLYNLYEANGFQRVNRRFVGPYDLAFYQYEV